MLSPELVEALINGGALALFSVLAYGVGKAAVSVLKEGLGYLKQRDAALEARDRAFAEALEKRDDELGRISASHDAALLSTANVIKETSAHASAALNRSSEVIGAAQSTMTSMLDLVAELEQRATSRRTG